MFKTLSYSKSSLGWVSFYSFNPEWMIGMNNYFYSFNKGNVYRHNTNLFGNMNRFYFYDYTSKVTSVLNNAPLENKLFKTINIEGDDSWSALLSTDIQDTGFIDKAWFEKKEQSFYAFIRNSGTSPAQASEYDLRSLNGIGQTSNTTTGVGTATVDFSVPILDLGTIISVGDSLYFFNPVPSGIPPTIGPPLFAGVITAINIDLKNGINNIVIDTTPAGTTAITPATNFYFLYIKNATAESHGVLGHYCIFELENNNQFKVELFMVESEVMKSFP